VLIPGNKTIMVSTKYIRGKVALSRWFAVYCSITLLLLMTGCRGYEERATARFTHARELMNEEKFDEAARELGIVAYSYKHSELSIEAESLRRSCEAGNLALGARSVLFNGNVNEAVRLTHIAHELDENLPLVIFVDGLVAYSRGNMDKAYNAFERLKEYDKEEEYLKLSIGMAMLIHDNPYKAAESFNTTFMSSKRRPIKEQALRGLALARLAMQIPDARNLPMAFSPDSPDLYLIYYVSGKMYSETDGLNYPRAEYNLRCAINLSAEKDPEVAAEAQHLLAALLIKKPGSAEERQMYLKEAKELADAALASNPERQDYQLIAREAQRLRALEKAK
jgi:hypothetical protein